MQNRFGHDPTLFAFLSKFGLRIGATDSLVSPTGKWYMVRMMHNDVEHAGVFPATGDMTADVLGFLQTVNNYKPGV